MFSKASVNSAKYRARSCSAPDARPRGQEIRSILGAGLRGASPAARRSLFSPRFVGRERERAQLAGALDAVAHERRPRCVRVHGISGMAQLSVGSTVAVAAMFAGGMLVANLFFKRV